MAKKAAAARSTKATGGDDWELLGGEGGTEMEVGEVVIGVYGGITRYHTPKGKGKKTPIPFYQVGDRALLGGAVLKARIEEGQILPGDELEVTRLEDADPKPGQSPAKIYKVRVRRVVSQKPDGKKGATAPKRKRV
jgi:hypothetical protein